MRRLAASSRRVVQQQQRVVVATASSTRRVVVAAAASSQPQPQRSFFSTEEGASAGAGAAPAGAAPAAKKKVTSYQYESLRGELATLVVGVGNFYNWRCRHSVGLRVIDYLVTDHLGWKWTWEPRVRGWLSLGTIELPHAETGELITKYVGFLKPGTYNILANSMSVKRAVHLLGASVDQTIICHFDPAQSVGWYGPAYQELNEQGHDAEVMDVRFLDEIRTALRIPEEQTYFQMKRFALGVDAPDNDQDRLLYNPGTMKVIGQNILDEAYLSSLFSPKQEAIFQEKVMKNADHVLKTMLDILDRSVDRKVSDWNGEEEFAATLETDDPKVADGSAPRPAGFANKITAPSQDLVNAVFESLRSKSIAAANAASTTGAASSGNNSA